MAKFVLKNAFVSIAGVDLSDHVESVELPLEVQLQEATAMGDNAPTRLSGLEDAALNVNFRQDFASSNVDDTLFSNRVSEVAIKVRPDTGAIASTNPEYQFNGRLESYTPIGGSVGEVAAAPATFRLSDGAVVVRDTTP